MGARRKLKEFAYGDVKLTEGPLGEMYRRMQAHFLSLDEDRILKVYRQRAGMPAPGRDMGGWYDADGFVPGHLIGQFISALARIHAHTGDAAAAAKAKRLVRGYGETFERSQNPYASGKAQTWACYILDKYEIGLIDAYRLAGVEEARPLLRRVWEGAKRTGWIPDHTFDRIGVKNPPYDEPYVLPENLFLAHEVTGDQRFLELAKLYLLDEAFFDPLAKGNNVLPGKHGYSHIIALSSAAKAYEVLGNGKHLEALRNAWRHLEETQQYASGAWAPEEMFVVPELGQLGESLTRTRDHYETPCCYYAHAKLARYLTSFTAESRYGDGLERVLLNTILGALDPDDDGGYYYYADYQSGARKKYYQRKWPCCAGTLAQSVADYPLNIYLHDEGGVNVNLYAGSEVRWKRGEAELRLRQKTDFPLSGRIEIEVEASRLAEFALRLRMPGWLGSEPEILVNGRRAGVRAVPGQWAALERKWRSGDRVELTLPFSTRAVPVDGKHPNTVALMNGPLMLVACNPPEKLEAGRESLEKLRPVSGQPQQFQCAAATGHVHLKPFYQVQRERYTTYIERKGEA